MPRRAAAISHAVDLSAYSNYVVSRIVGLLDSVDADLYSAILTALEKMPVNDFSMSRLESLLASVRTVNADAYRVLDAELGDRMIELLSAELDFQTRLVGSPDVRAVPIETAWSAAVKQPIRGRLLSDWASSLEAGRAQRIQQALSIGYVEGKTVPEMVRTLRGTRSENYTNGLLNIDRRNAEAVVRTVTAHFAASAREQVYAANEDVIDHVIWMSTLDMRTSEICQIRDGAEYTLEGKPIGHSMPWLGGPGKAHWNCRSHSSPVLKDGPIDLSKGRVRTSVDGPVPGTTTFAGWIAKQSAARQNEVLGPTRAALMRQGKYKLPQFYDNKGRFLTIEQLRSSDEATFKELGL